MFRIHYIIHGKKMTEAIVPVIKSLTKSAICQSLKKPARQGSKLADKGAYIDVSDRSLQAQLTQQTKILTTFLLFVRIFVFAGFVRGLMTEANYPCHNLIRPACSLSEF